MRRGIPKVGKVFRSKEEVVERLRRSGWKFEGEETYLHTETRKIIGYNVGVIDPDTGTWLLVELDLLPKGVRITSIKTRRGGKGKWRYEFPKTYIPITGLDSGIKSLIKDLNEAGYTTEYSCAGHGRSRGYVNFIRKDFTKEELEDLRDIFRLNGIRRVTFRVLENYIRATFPGIG